jgi:hypothetical protein
MAEVTSWLKLAYIVAAVWVVALVVLFRRPTCK